MPADAPPFNSVIIPVFNDPDGLRDTVDSLIAQDLSRDAYEIIIVDNGSTDETWSVANRFAEEHGPLVSAVRESDIQGSYAARNRGIEVARGEVLCFLDADMIAPGDYLRRVNKRFAESDVDYLACAVELKATSDSASSIYNCVTGFPIARYLERGHYAPTCCLCVRRRCINDLGPFDARLESGGDMEFGQRVYDAGLKQQFAPAIVLLHPARSSFQALLSKQCRIARGHAQLSYYYPERYALFLELYVRTTRYFAPANPVRLHARCQELEFDVGLFLPGLLGVFHIPLAWAGLAAYLREARRLRLRDNEMSR